jgi:hypothetical protein
LVLWDGEEKGLLGSKYWTAHPTFPLDHVSTALNVDMIGALRDHRVTVFGSRTGYGLRRAVSQQNQDDGLLIDFAWPMIANADHYSFFLKGIPVLFFHTGLHERYHQPTDDAAHIDREGMKVVTRLVFSVAYELASRPEAARFRVSAGQENEQGRQQMAAADPSPVKPGDPPLRFGITWRLDEAEPGTIVLSHVVAGSPAAAAGLAIGDRICRIGGHDFPDEASFMELSKKLPGPIELLVERDGRFRVVVVHFPTEAAIKRAA